MGGGRFEGANLHLTAMSDTIISVEGLGKKYVLSHQGERGGYSRFSEKLEGWIKKPFAAVAGDRRKKMENRGSSTPLSPNSHLLSSSSEEEFWALKDVSFEVKRGEVVGIIGRNGAGKSTLLKILSRITEPSEGRVTWRGRVASLLEVGRGFHPELTGRENIFLNGAILGMTKAEIKKKFDEIVAFAEVERFLDTPVKRYSSGMYVRLAFAVAAHLEPEILVVDEVLAVGDAEFQKKCLGKMKDVATGGRTVLFVSHNMGVVQSLCSQGILLDQGKMTKRGEIRQVITSYNAQQNSGKEIQRKNNSKKEVFISNAKAELKNQNLILQMTIYSVINTKISIEARLLDTNKSPLAFLSKGRLDLTEKVLIQKGVNKLFLKCLLPRLYRGKYYLWLSIADPLIRYLDICEDLLELQVEHSPIKGSLIEIDPASGNGHIDILFQE